MSQSLEDRICLVYRALTGATSDRGARVWFAAQARVRPWTVTRWLTGRRTFRGPAAALLETLEAQAEQ